jgi:hypothetical protein
MPSSPDLLVPAKVGRASVVGAFLEGWRRVLDAPALAVGLVAATALIALPLTMTLQEEMERHFGSSLEAARARAAWNPIWTSEFSDEASTLGRTFTHEVLGFGGTLAALSRFVDNAPLNPSIAAVVAAYVALWIFLSGGILDRLARGRRIGAAAFFSACAGYFVRFVRLAAIIGPCYWMLFRFLHPYLFTGLYDRFTRDLVSEQQAVAVRAALYAVFLTALAAVNLVADFAKVRAVVEDRRSMLSALVSALRFIRRRPFRVLALYLINVVAALVVLRLWMQVAPGASAPIWLALLGGQLYLLTRIWARLAFMASEVAFFQGELAHAGFAAAPERIWPDSPAVEAIRNLNRLK